MAHVHQYVGTNASQESAASTFKAVQESKKNRFFLYDPQGGGIKFLRNADDSVDPYINI
jgi:hypothetical protein